MSILESVKKVIKEDIEQGKEILLVLLSYPAAFIAVVALFVIGIIADMHGVNSIYGFIEIILMAFIAAILAITLMFLDNPKEYIAKTFFFSLLWLASCLVMVDFNDFSWLLIIRIVAAFEFIFLACLFPDFMTKLKEIREENINKNKENENQSGEQLPENQRG